MSADKPRTGAVRIRYHIPNDTPHIETLPEEPSRAHMEAVAEIVGAVAYTPEWFAYCQRCGRKLRHHEDVGTYCPSGCPLEVDDVDRDHMVSLPGRRGDDGLPAVCAVDGLQTR